MPRGYLALVAILVIAVALACRTPRAYGEGYSFGIGNVELVRRPLKPGDVAIVSFTLSYVGRGDLVDVEVALHPLGKWVEVLDGVKKVSSWRSGEVKRFTFALKPLKELPVSGKLQVKVSWAARAITKATGGFELTSSEACDLTFELTIWSDPLIEVDVTPSKLVTGSSTSMAIKLRNVGGGVAKDLRVKLALSGLAVLDKPEPIVLSTAELKPGDEFEVRLTVVPLSQSPSVTAEVSFIDEGGNERQVSVRKLLYTTSGGALYIVPKPSIVDAGKRHEVTLTVVSSAESELKDIKIKLAPAAGSGIIVETPLLELKELSPLSSAELKAVFLVPSSALGPQAVNYEVVYRLPEGGIGRETGNFVINSMAAPNVKVISVDLVPREPKVNKTLTLSISLLNVGPLVAEAVNVSITAPPELEIVRRSYIFIGQLSPQSPMSVAFSFIPKRPGKYKIEYRIVYGDAYGRVYSLVKEYSIAIKETVEAKVEVEQPPWLMGVLVAAVVVVAVVIALLVRKHGVRRR